MDFASNISTTLTGPDVPKAPLILGLLDHLGPSKFQSPLTLTLTALATAIVSFLAYALHTPSVHKQSPAFTSDTLPIIGSFGFIARQWCDLLFPHSLVKRQCWR